MTNIKQNFKYALFLNQKAVIDNHLDLDINDLAIFDIIKDFTHTKHCKKLIDGNEIFYWISYQLIIDQLPIAKIKSKDTVYRRIRKLIAASILVPHPDNQSRGQTYYKFGANYDLLIFSERSDNYPKGGTANNPKGGTDEMPDYNNTSIYNNTISINKKNAEKEISAFGDSEVFDFENENASKDETLNSSNQEKKEKSSAQKEKKGRRPRKPVEPLHTPLKQVFLKKYEAATELSYYWTAADGKNLNALIAKIRKTFEDQGKEISQESITDFFQIMLDNLPQWIRNGAYSVKVINSKYNEVLNNMKNGKSTNRRHDPARVMAKLSEYDD